MKKTLVSLILLIAVLFPAANAQEEDDYRFTIKTNPLSALGGPLFLAFIPITGEYKVLFEARTSQKQSIEAGVGYLGPSILLNLDQISSGDSISGINTSGFHVQLGYKFFLTKESAPEGFFIGPHVSYAAAKLKSKDNPDDHFEAKKLNASILFGYQLITSGGFTLNIYTGLGFKHRDYIFAEESEDLFDFDPGNKNVPNVPFGFTFGYAF
ncbi:MAG: DUF3575 domain-containing protein [Bacteroidales bacterium]|nr:DUF3575 domain-containing protein [Bacteroidales bacterium]